MQAIRGLVEEQQKTNALSQETNVLLKETNALLQNGLHVDKPGALSMPSTQRSASLLPSVKDVTQAVQHHVKEGMKVSFLHRKVQTIASRTKICTWVRNTKGPNQLVYYNFDKLQSFAAIPAVFFSCSVFRLRYSVLLQLALECAVVATVYGLLKLQDVTGDFGDWSRRIKDDILPVVELSNFLNAAVPFLLGLFVASYLKRWWTVRAQYVQKMFSS